MESSHEKRSFIAYPRTCSFSWNCFNQIAYVANQKYNFEIIKQKPELKRQRDWPAQRLLLTQESPMQEDSYIYSRTKEFLSEEGRDAFS